MKRIELLLKEPLYQENMNLNAQEEQEARYCLHDFQHHLDVARIAYILVLENNDLNYFIKENGLSGKLAAKELIYAAGLLHDIGKWKEQREGVDHASFGARVAREILPHAFFNTREIEIIGRAIYEHSNISTEMSFLGERIHRADNLSRISNFSLLCSECSYRNLCPKVKKMEITISSFDY